jgi:acylphosphatase
MTARQLLIAGQVHRGFRDWVTKTAKLWGVSGWIRNLPDGRVEVVAVADEGTIDAFIDHCREAPSAEIVAIDVAPAQVHRLQAKGFTARLAA